MKVKRISDARRTQGRVIFHLECGCNRILQAEEVEDPLPTELECRRGHEPDPPSGSPQRALSDWEKLFQKP